MLLFGGDAAFSFVALDSQYTESNSYIWRNVVSNMLKRVACLELVLGCSHPADFASNRWEIIADRHLCLSSTDKQVQLELPPTSNNTANTRTDLQNINYYVFSLTGVYSLLSV